jgi:hypothetical protein
MHVATATRCTSEYVGPDCQSARPSFRVAHLSHLLQARVRILPLFCCPALSALGGRRLQRRQRSLQAAVLRHHLLSRAGSPTIGQQTAAAGSKRCRLHSECACNMPFLYSREQHPGSPRCSAVSIQLHCDWQSPEILNDIPYTTLNVKSNPLACPVPWQKHCKPKHCRCKVVAGIKSS